MCIAERAVYSTRFITLYDDDVRFADGRTGRYHRLVSSGGRPGVVVMPRCRDRVALVRVYRYPVGEWEWGLPRGMALSEDPAMTAVAELAEELGGEPEVLIPLGVMTPDTEILAGKVHLFAARYPEEITGTCDPGEVDDTRWETIPDLLEQIGAGDITDGFTLATVCRALCTGLL